MADLQSVRGQLRDILSGKETAVKRWPALLGDGNDTVEVSTRPGFVYVRAIDGTPLGQAFNRAVPNRDDLPIIVGYTNENPSLFQVISVRDVYLDTDDYESTIWGLLPHHETHELGNEDGGDDVVWVRQQQVIPLLARPTDPESMTVEVLEGLYSYVGTWKLFDQTTSANLTSYLPSSGYKKFVLIGIDAANNELNYTDGTEYAVTYPRSPDDMLPTPPGGTLPIVGVYLTADTSSIGWDELTDVRTFITTNESAAHVVGGLEAEVDFRFTKIQEEIAPWIATQSAGGLEAEIDFVLSRHIVEGIY